MNIKHFIVGLCALAGSMMAQPSQMRVIRSGPNCVRLAWITPTPGTHVMKVYASGGALLDTVSRIAISPAVPDPDRTHVVLACGYAPSTTYDLEGCSSEGGGPETCSAKVSQTTEAAGATEPTLPTAVDVAWTAGGNTPKTVAANCRDSTNGLQALINGAVAGDRIVIPTTTKNCGMVTIKDFGAGTNGILITTDATNLPPTGARDSTDWGHSTIYRNWTNIENDSNIAANRTPGTKVDIQFTGPGSIFTQSATGTWNAVKAALSGPTYTVTNASNTNPIVVTTSAAHGFSNGDAACVTGVVGNLAANGCGKAASVTATTFALTLRDGSTNQAGSGAYVSGGTVRGLVYTTIPRTDIADPAGDACVTPGEWARDTDVTNYIDGMYRCTDQLVYLKVETSLTYPQPTDGAQIFNAAINADVNAHHYRIRGINFADPGWPPEPEFAYAPAAFALTYGTKVGGVFRGGRGSHHIDMDQNIAMSDIGAWRTEFMFDGFTYDFAVRNSSMSCGAYYPNIYISENEMQCYGFSLPASIGPLSFSNNYCKSGGFCMIQEGSGGYTNNQNLTFDGNHIAGALEFQFGTAYYTKTAPLSIKTRQLFELKTGSRVSFRGNYFDGVVYSTSPASPAILTSTQTTNINFVAITAGGVATAGVTNPYPLSVQVGDKFFTYNNTPLQTNILTVASKTASTVTFTMFDGSPYSLSAQSSGQLCNLNALTIDDVTIENNEFDRVPAPFELIAQTFGFFPSSGYGMCQPGPTTRVSVKNNHARLTNIFPIGGWFGSSPPGTSIQTNAWINGYVNDVTYTRNSATCDTATSNFGRAMTRDSNLDNIKGAGLLGYGNILCAENLGVSGNGATGTTLLGTGYPQGYTWTRNAYMRSGGAIAGEPAGNVYPTVAQIGFDAAGYPGVTSAYAPYSADPVAISRARGLLTNIRPSVTSSTVVVRFTSPVAGQNWYAETSVDGGTTWVRATSTGSGYEQTATVAAVTKTVYDVRVIGPAGITTIGKVRTQ